MLDFKTGDVLLEVMWCVYIIINIKLIESILCVHGFRVFHVFQL